jgi:C4-dicarboxylate-specific signal transduction histidine kinase
MERDARLMSMDAVAAAISHEVGQPLAAISLNASVGLKSLTGRRPNLKRAIDSFRAVSDSAQRSFAIITGVRAMFANDPEWGSEFNLNDMVRETTALLNRELAAAKISINLSLDERMPPLFANRVQLQQVLVNLLKNAIESSVSTRGRARSIAIRSRLDDERMLLEVSDEGAGISNDEVPHIFDAFHTTKASGTGIGLSLCRTIVEEHGGRIWASQGRKHGATFHVQLPRSSPAPLISVLHHQ